MSYSPDYSPDFGSLQRDSVIHNVPSSRIESDALPAGGRLPKSLPTSPQQGARKGCQAAKARPARRSVMLFHCPLSSAARALPVLRIPSELQRAPATLSL